MPMKKNDNHFTAMLWIVVGVFGRLLPLPPNMTPITSLALFSGTQLPRKVAFLISLLALAVSDIFLARLHGHEIFGLWSIFTYSGFAMIVMAGFWLKSDASAGRTFAALLGSSVFFWLWTNLGVWLVGGIYPMNGQGFVACYVAALPFLRNSMLGDLAWGFVFFAGFSAVRQLAAKKGFAVEGA